MPSSHWQNCLVTYARTHSTLPCGCSYKHTHDGYRYIQPYLSAFFSLPVKRLSGERLSHEEVVDQLDEQTVFYEVGLGTSGVFSETLRITIRVEVAKYEVAVAWLRDLLYGSEFTKERSVLFCRGLEVHGTDDGLNRLQITAAQIQQALPGLKRDGSTVLSAVTSELLHDESSTARASGVLIQSDFMRSLSEKIQEAPEEVIQEFENIRRNSEYLLRTIPAPNLSTHHHRQLVTDPTGARFSVTGNILGVSNPRSTWNKYFGTALPVSRAAS